MNRSLAIALVLVLSGAVLAAAPDARPSVAAGNSEGLRLLATLGTNAPAEFLPGQAIPMEVELLNVSKARAYLVVKPGDGSESGWREPHVYYTADRSGADGGWTRMEPTPILRCGLYDNKWQKDVVPLKPGENLPLKDWLMPPGSAFEFQQAGRYRIRAHYAYRGGQGGKGAASRPAEDVGGMKGIAPFEIVSSPVEIAVKRPLNVTLKVRRNLIADQPARLSDLLDIAVGNDSDKPINAAHPTLSAEGRLTLQMRAELGWGPTLDKQDNPHAATMDIQPGQSVSLLGKGAFANGLDGSWTYPRAEAVKLRAGYTPSTWKDIGTVWSDWVEVTVDPTNVPPASLDGYRATLGAVRKTQLAEQIDSGEFHLLLQYHAAEKDPVLAAQEEPYSSIWFLRVDVVPPTAVRPGWTQVMLTKPQARAIAAWLDAGGHLGVAIESNSGKYQDGLFKGPGYTLAWNHGMSFVFVDLGWNLKTREQLQSLRKVLEGDAAKAMDGLLKQLTPQPKAWDAAAPAGSDKRAEFARKYQIAETIEQYPDASIFVDMPFREPLALYDPNVAQECARVAESLGKILSVADDAWTVVRTDKQGEDKARPMPNAGPEMRWIDRKTARTLFSAWDIVRFDWDRQVMELTDKLRDREGKAVDELDIPAQKITFLPREGVNTRYGSGEPGGQQ